MSIGSKPQSRSSEAAAELWNPTGTADTTVVAFRTNLPLETLLPTIQQALGAEDQWRTA
jgi:hypothetical protein